MARVRNNRDQVKHTDNSTVYRKAKRDLDLVCPLCPPHKGSNRPPRLPKHGVRKPRKKDHRG